MLHHRQRSWLLSTCLEPDQSSDDSRDDTILEISFTGLMEPRMLETCAKQTSFVFDVNISSRDDAWRRNVLGLTFHSCSLHFSGIMRVGKKIITLLREFHPRTNVCFVIAIGHC